MTAHCIQARLAGLVAAALLATAARAETTVTRAQDATSGKPSRIVVAPNLKKDCSSGPMPEIKIIAAPKNGSIITKSGSLKTPASYRCPDKDAQVQAVFYRSNPGFTGSDAVVVEIKGADGTIERQDIRLTVGGSAKDGTKEKGATDL